MGADGTWALLRRQVQGRAEAAGDSDWDAQVNSTVVRARRTQFRAIATRYDKLKLHWQASNDIVETIDWIRATPDKPRS